MISDREKYKVEKKPKSKVAQNSQHISRKEFVKEKSDAKKWFARSEISAEASFGGYLNSKRNV